MKNIYTILLTSAILIAISTDSNQSHINKKIQVLEEATIKTINDFYLLDLFNNPKVSIKNQKIYIHLDLNRNISNIDNIERFKNFKIFTKRLRFVLKNYDKTDGESLSKKEIILSGEANKISFQYTSKLTNKDLIQMPESFLSINQKIVLSSSEFARVSKFYLSKDMIKIVNGYKDIDIHQYARRLFKIITKNGKDYEPSSDDQLILDAVCNKFQITPNEYTKIDNKYYLYPAPTESLIETF